MTESTTPDSGLTRRTMIRRSALVGGSLVWAAPAVQSLSGTAFAQTNGSPPPDQPPGVTANAPSNVVLLLLCDGKYYQVKFDAGASGLDCGPRADPPLPDGARDEWNALTAGYDIEDDCPPGVTGSAADVNAPICVNLGMCTWVKWGVFDGNQGTPTFFHNAEPIPAGFDVQETGGTICFSKDF